jgi:hypothetical protein
VGAGGSKEVGLPTGDELKHHIAANVNIGSLDGNNLVSGSEIISNAYINKYRMKNPSVFFETGRSIAKAMPLSASIDNFLDAHSYDQDIILMGKMGIAVSISQAEKSSKIYKENMELDRNISPLFVETWHSTFCKMAWEGIGKAQISDIFNNVSIITFNYDRVIETYVSEAVKQYYLLDTNEAQEIASRLEVIHVYGQIGRMIGWPGDGVELPFGGNLDNNNLFEISEQISVFTEDYHDETKLRRIHELLKEADVIVYIGFSFAGMNMKLLSTDSPGNLSTVFGTALNVSYPNVTSIQKQINTSLHGRLFSTPTLVSEGGKVFLENYWMPIMD